MLAVVFGIGVHAADITGDEIIRGAVDSDRHQEVLRQQYLYREHQENGPAAADGSHLKVRVDRDFEVIFLEGGFYRKMVAVDGKPLKPKQAREEEEKLRMTAAERKTKHLNPKFRHTGVPLSAILSVMDHKLLREDEIDGRKCWVVQSEPKPGAAAQTPYETQALSYRYIHWIDERDQAVARIEWEVVKAGVETKPGSTVKVTFAKNGDGAWLARKAEFFSINGDKLGGNRFFQTNVYSDYRKFTAETNIEFEDKP